MNVSGIDSQYLAALEYMPLSNQGEARNSPASTAGFERMLERAEQQNAEQSAGQGETGPVILEGGKASIDKSSKLFESCREFETFLVKTLISSMRNTIQKTNLVDTGYAGQFYEDMLYDEYAKDFSKNAGFGFAEMAYLELTGQRGKSLGARPDFVKASD